MSRLPIVLVVALALLIAGCASPRPVDTGGEQTAAHAQSSAGDDRAEVPWDDYAPEVRRRIDELTEAADCAALQDEFDAADANNAATEARTGHNNADLLQYIDEGLRLAGCY